MLSSDVGAAAQSILIVDDSLVQRAHAVGLCRELGVGTVHEASNGREALEMLRSLSPLPELLLIDLYMPTMDGPELLAELRQAGIDIPIAVASNHSRSIITSVRRMGEVMGLRIVGGLQKPLTREMVAAALRKASNTPHRHPKRQEAVPIGADELLAALEGNELSVCYQPKVELRTGTLSGVEALARWHHPPLGWISPESFIPLAERTGLIHRLTLQVINHALLQATVWRSAGLDLTLAINLSPALLQHVELVQQITDLKSYYGIAAERVIFEVTETALPKDRAVTLELLTRLRLRGFGLSLDDYGTGFAPMRQLAETPFTELKLDRSLTFGAHEDTSLQVMLRSALRMSRELGLDAVAEGLEVIEDARLLDEYDCKFGQGLLLGEPMTAQDLGTWMKEYELRKCELARPRAALTAG